MDYVDALSKLIRALDYTEKQMLRYAHYPDYKFKHYYHGTILLRSIILERWIVRQ